VARPQARIATPPHAFPAGASAAARVATAAADGSPAITPQRPASVLPPAAEHLFCWVNASVAGGAGHNQLPGTLQSATPLQRQPPPSVPAYTQAAPVAQAAAQPPF
jgi:hypothetical protein